MNRQKAFLIRTTNTASRLALRAWHRWHFREEVPSTLLDSVRRRLELLLAAMYGRTIRIEDAGPARKASWISRLVSGTPCDLGSEMALSASDGETIRLPSLLRYSDAIGSVGTQYRLLAIEHAERIVRGTGALVPDDDRPLERDLYLLAEAAAVDSTIARTVGGMADLIRDARASALARRPALTTLTLVEREVELLARQVLSSTPHELPMELGTLASSVDSLAWAHEIAGKLRTNVRGPTGRYRGVAPVALWGTVSRAASATMRSVEDETQGMLDSASTLDTDIEEEGSAGANGGQKRIVETQEIDGSDHVGDAKSKESNPSEAIPEATAGGSAELPRHIQGRPPQDGGNLLPDNRTPRSTVQSTTASAPVCASTDYPEWDCNARKYRPRGATVRTYRAPEDGLVWVNEVLSEHSVLIRSVRQRFDRLRSRRVQLPRRRDGDELDLAACVRALVDARSGHSVDDRLYVAVTPARRALAITLLVDVSGSTAQQVTDTRRVIDVERVALLLASEALDALGEVYSILTFSSYGAADVRVARVKSFDERNGDSVRQRISAIAPQGETRLGAAVRHATAQLARQPVGHRLLLILSDGKPNDTDRYFEHYAAEDTRQAIFEARALKVYPFCLTVDHDEASEYLSHIFGSAGYTTLREPDQLPLALLQGVQHLLES